MKDNLKGQQIIHPSDEKIAFRPQKAAYSSPVLQVYGSVGNLTQNGGATVADSMGMAMGMASDRRVKQNILRIGDHPLGFGLYLFDYKPEFCQEHGSGRQFGVLANEVETVMPEAVSIHPDGYKMVSYAMLGISQVV
jgi:hypothetical protein